jgi:hypothetical protein
LISSTIWRDGLALKSCGRGSVGGAGRSVEGAEVEGAEVEGAEAVGFAGRTGTTASGNMKTPLALA